MKRPTCEERDHDNMVTDTCVVDKVEINISYAYKFSRDIRVFRKHPTTNNFCDFNFVNDGLRIVYAYYLIIIFGFSFSQTPINLQNSRK